MAIWQILIGVYLSDFLCKNSLGAHRWVEGKTTYGKTIRDTERNKYHKKSYKHLAR